MIQFFIDGVPRTTQTGGVAFNRATGRSFPTRRNKKWTKHCLEAALPHRPATPLDWVAAGLVFLMPRLSEATIRKYIRAGQPPPAWPERADMDNLKKGLLDAWQGVLYGKDARIVAAVDAKDWDDRPGIHVTIVPVEPGSTVMESVAAVTSAMARAFPSMIGVEAMN